jgi:hypothetical protein
MLGGFVKTELTDEQKDVLCHIWLSVPPEDTRWLMFYGESESNNTLVPVNQDTLPVIRAYLDLIEEKCNG